MIRLKINNQEISINKDCTILEASKKINIDIPTLCHYQGHENFSSCMVCVVENIKTKQLIPACSTIAEDGMIIETENDNICELRKSSLELLLSEHLGDCRGVCQRVCPSEFNIPKFIRLIQQKSYDNALKMLKENIPKCVNEECSAPCEKVCRRGKVDSTIPIKNLISFIAKKDNKLLNCEPRKNKKTKKYESTIANLSDDSIANLIKLLPENNIISSSEIINSDETAIQESMRCLHCDCRKNEECKLLEFTQKYEAKQNRYKNSKTSTIIFNAQHNDIIFEEGKCIKCGICVHIAQEHNEKFGLCFTNRGLSTKIQVPFKMSLSDGLEKASKQCVKNCPTGALSFKVRTSQIPWER